MGNNGENTVGVVNIILSKHFIQKSNIDLKLLTLYITKNSSNNNTKFECSIVFWSYL